MADYISREAAKDKHCQNCMERAICYRGDGDSCPERKSFDTIPAADVRPVVHGEWLRGPTWSEGFGMGESYGYYWDCSECRKRVRGDYNECGYNYCPHCGVYMR